LGLFDDDDESMESADEFPDEPESDPGPEVEVIKLFIFVTDAPAKWAIACHPTSIYILLKYLRGRPEPTRVGHRTFWQTL